MKRACRATLLLLAVLLWGSPGAATEEHTVYRDRPISDWIRALRSDDVQVRRDTAKDLRTLAPGVHALIPSLGEAIFDADEGVRRLAVESLGELAYRYEEALLPLMVVSEKGDPGLRLLALRTLSGIWVPDSRVRSYRPAITPEIYRAITARLKDESPEIRRAAAAQIGKMRLPDRPRPPADYWAAVTRPLLEALQDEDPLVRREAAETAGGLDLKDVLVPLGRALEDPDIGVRHRAALSLGRLNPQPRDTIPRIAGVLASDDAGIRWKALDVLEDSRVKLLVTWEEGHRRSIAADRAAIVPVLERMLQDPDSKVRERVVSLLASMGAGPRGSINEIIKKLRSPNRSDKEWAAGTLAALGKAAIPAVPVLIDALGGERLMHGTALAVLEKIGPDAAEVAVQAFLSPLDEGRTRQLGLIEALRIYGPQATKRVIEGLITELRNPDPRVRIEVTNAVAQFGQEAAAAGAVPLLVEGLSDADPMVRRSCAWALGTTGPAALPARGDLERALKDTDPWVREYASNVLRSFTPAREDSIPELLRLLETGGLAERTRALEVANNMGAKAAPLLPAVLEALGVEGAPLGGKAMMAIAVMGEAAVEALPVLVRMMRAKVPARIEDVSRVVRGLAYNASRPVPELIESLQDPDVEVRRWTAWCLAGLRERGGWAVPALMARLEDTDGEVRIEAALALVELDAGHDGARQVLLAAAPAPGGWKVLGRDVPPVRSASETLKVIEVALGKLSRHHPARMDGTTTLLSSQHAPFRAWALRELVLAGRDAEPFAPLLLEIFRDPNRYDRTTAADALGLIGVDTAGSVQALMGALDDGDAGMRAAAARALGQIGPGAAGAIPALARLLEDPDGQVVGSAADALSTMGEQAAGALEALLAEALRPGERPSRAAAASALWAIDPEGRAIIPPLLRALGDEDAAIGAVRALELIGPEAKSELPALQKALRDRGHPGRAAVATCIGRLGEAARPAVPSLIQAMSDRDPAVAGAAKEALRRIGIAKPSERPSSLPADDDRIYRGRPVREWKATLLGGDVQSRRDAAREMKASGPGIHALIPALGSALSDDNDEEVRRLSAEALRGLVHRYDSALPQITAAAGSPSPDARLLALRTIAEMWPGWSVGHGPGPPPLTPEVCRAVAALLRDESPAIRALAAETLAHLRASDREVQAKCNEAIAPLLAGSLQDEDADVRRQAASTIGRLDKELAKSLLRSALEDPDAGVRHRAALVLTRIDPHPGSTIPILAEILSDEDKEIRRQAIDALRGYASPVPVGATYQRKIPPEMVAIVPGLIRALSDPDSSVRLGVINLLADLGPEARSAVPALIERLGSQQEKDAWSIVHALGQIGPDAMPAIPALLEALARERLRLREKINEALSRMGPGAAQAVVAWLVDPVKSGRVEQLGIVEVVFAFGHDGPRRAAEALVPLMRSPEARIRREVAAALGRIGAKEATVVLALTEALSHPDAEVRRASAAALAALGGAAKQARPALERAQSDEDAMVRDRATAAISAMTPVSAPEVPDLILLLGSGDPMARRRAIDLLSRVPSLPAEAMPAIVEALPLGDEAFVRRALPIIGKTGEAGLDAVPALMKLFRRGSPVPSREIVPVIWAIGRDLRQPLPAVADALEDPDAGVRRLAAWMIGGLQRLGPWAGAALVEALGDEDRDVRIQAAIALVGTPAEEDAVRAIVLEAAADPGDWVALDEGGREDPEKIYRVLGRALAGLKSTRPGEIAELGPLLRDDYAPFRLWAIERLQRAGRDAEPETPLLIETLADPDPNMRAAAAATLGSIGSSGPGVLAALHVALSDEGPVVRSAAASAMGLIGPASEEQVPDLIMMLDDPYVGAVGAAVVALGGVGVGAASALDALMKEALRPVHSDLRESAAKALWGIDPQGLTILPILLESQADEARRRGAVRALELAGPQARQAMPMLLAILGNPDSPWRVSAAVCLGNMGPAARRAAPALFKAKNDRDPALAGAAAKALEQVGSRR